MDLLSVAIMAYSSSEGTGSSSTGMSGGVGAAGGTEKNCVYPYSPALRNREKEYFDLYASSAGLHAHLHNLVQRRKSRSIFLI